jgi:hypothetical protein|tara:strand:+ start:200 stop:547 length:348 start_codon:yes stop_codon:yes gene_type:complete
MRTLNDYFLPGGIIATIHTVDTENTDTVIPDGGTLQAIYMHVHTLIDATTTFDIYKNGSDSGVDATLADATPDESGVALSLGGSVEYAAGDAIKLRSNGEQSGATTVDVTYVIRR